MTEGDAQHFLHVLVQQDHQGLGLRVFRQRGEVCHVGEQKGHFPAFPADLHELRVGDQSIDDGRRYVVRERGADKALLLTVEAPQEGDAAAPGRGDRDRRRDQRQQEFGGAVNRETTNPVTGHDNNQHADLDWSWSVEGGDHHSQQSERQRDNGGFGGTEAWRAAAFEHLCQRMGVDDDTGKLAPGAESGGERSPVTVDQRQVGTDQDDLAGEPILRQEPRGMGWEHAERRCLGVGRRPVGERNVRGGWIGTGRLGQGADETPPESAAVILSGKDPAHGAVITVFDEIDHAGVQSVTESREEGLLGFGQLRSLAGGSQDDGRLHAQEDVPQCPVLFRFGRLVKQDIDADGGGTRRVQVGKQAGQEPAVDGGAVG